MGIGRLLSSNRNYLRFRPRKILFLVGFCFILLVPWLAPWDGETTPATSVKADNLPTEYGEAICKYNPESPNQLYIVGISHRDTLTGENNSLTPRVQAEVYKIAEWLIRNKGLELLLPEGFFVEKDSNGKKGVAGSVPARVLTLESLEKMLSDDSTQLNAEMLLSGDFPLVMKQVEDRDLYHRVNKGIRQLVECREVGNDFYTVESELDYCQKKRVGTMLQNIPQIVEEEFRQGSIRSRTALFTIGLSHIPDIVRYLTEKKITVRSPLLAKGKDQDFVRDLNLAREDFGVSVIIPKSLGDQEILSKIRMKR
jgi:hypothetical protein